MVKKLTLYKFTAVNKDFLFCIVLGIEIKRGFVIVLVNIAGVQN